MKTLLPVTLLFIVSCSGAMHDTALPRPGGRPGQPSSSAAAAATDIEAAGLPMEAFDLLTRSTVDSCAICAGETRRAAFRLLDDHYRPGMTVRSDSANPLTSDAPRENHLVLAAQSTDTLVLTFRFHTADNHLVGISEADRTDEALAVRCNTAPDGTLFVGVLQIVEFAYGDGPTYLYHPSRNHLEVQCKLLEIDRR